MEHPPNGNRGGKLLNRDNEGMTLNRHDEGKILNHANEELLNTASPSQRPSSKAGLEILEIDHDAEKKLVRKLDLHIVPVVMLLYLLSFLDRRVNDHPALALARLGY